MTLTPDIKRVDWANNLIALKRLGFKPRTILDIGAHRGNWTKRVCLIWPKAKIFMIEANADFEKELKKIKPSCGVEIALLGDKPRRSVKYFASKLPGATEGNSIYKERTHFFKDCKVRKLPMTTLDSIITKRKLKNIDFIKIDTQGSELDIIKGGLKTLAQAEFVLMETQILEYNHGAPEITEVMVAMKEYGFKLFDIPEIHYLPTGEMAQADLLFAKKGSRFIRKGFMCCKKNDKHHFEPQKRWGNNSLVIFCGPGFEGKWSPKNLKKGIGGSEEAIIYLSRELAKIGWKVTVFGDPGQAAGIYDKVVYRSHLDCNPEDKFNVFIAWRIGEVINFNLNAKATYLWLHDVPIPRWYSKDKLAKITKVIVLSKYHRSLLPNVSDEKILISGNGINTPFLEKIIKKFSPKIHRHPYSLFYGSSYDRGLEYLLKMWPEVKAKVPDARLHVCYGWDAFLKYRQENWPRDWYQKMKKLLKQEGVIHHGRVGHPDLEKIMLGCSLFVYPCDFQEISCITAMRAQALGLVPVVIDRFALSETVQYGIKIKGDIRYQETFNLFQKELISILINKSRQEEIRPKMMNWALKQYNWSKVAYTLSKEFNKELKKI